MEQLQLFKEREFVSSDEQKKFAQRRLKAVTQYLEDQGIPPLFTSHALFELQKEVNDRGLLELKKEVS